MTEDVMRVTSRTLTRDEIDSINAVKSAGNVLVSIIRDNCPGSRETSLALTNAEQAVMWATKAIST